MAFAAFVAVNASCDATTNHCVCDETNEFCSDCNVEGFSFGVVDDNGKITECKKECPSDTFQKEVEGKKYCVKDCGDGYYKLDGTAECAKCMVGCASCTDDSKCDSCADGFMPVYDSQNVITECSDGSCPTGYYKKEDNSCRPCGDGCSECESDTKCTTCKESYFKNGDNCEKCDEKCATCSGTKDNCQTCTSGYLPVYDRNSDLTDCAKDMCPDGTYKDGGNSCYPCSENCTKCSSADECSACQSGYFYDDNKCPKCSDSCQTCTDNQDKCTKCAGGYKPVYDSDYAIIKCIKTSETCPDKTYDDNGSSCSPCHQSCKTCTSSGCATCEKGQFVNKNSGQCEACHSDCVECSGAADYCTACVDGKFVNNGKCDECDTKCEKCEGSSSKCTSCSSKTIPFFESESSTTISNCLEKCEGNRYSKDNKCYPCDSTCKTCNESQKCETCETNQFINSVDKCEDCDGKCLTCSGSAGACTQCATNLKTVYADAEEKIIEDCIAADTSCPSRHFDDQQMHCKVCNPAYHCTTCDNSESCSDCGGEYPTRLYESEEGETFTCGTECNGYTKNGKCISNCDKSRNCATCNNSHSCSSCKDGDKKYFIDELSAKSSSTEFEKCISGDSCPDRSYVFEVDQVAVCVQTPGNCVDNNCATCKKGFKGGKCGEQCEKYEFCPEGSSASTRGNCSEGCYGCNNNDATNGRSQCLSCLENHALVDGKCVPCGKNEKSELGNTSDKCEKDGLATWVIAVIVVAAVVGVALIVGLGFVVSRCVKEKGPSIGVATSSHDVLFDDDDVELPVSKKGKKSDIPDDAFI